MARPLYASTIEFYPVVFRLTCLNCSSKVHDCASPFLDKTDDSVSGGYSWPTGVSPDLLDPGGDSKSIGRLEDMGMTT